MPVEIIAALSRNRVIGRDNRLPWRLPEDLRRFKALTLGKAVIMGRRTWESILAALGKPLPGRRSIVLTRRPGPAAPGCEVAGSLDEALALVGDGDAMVIGGASVYAAALPRCRRLHLTLVDAEVEGDAFFPELRMDEWDVREEGAFTGPPESPHPCRFLTLERRAAASAAPAGGRRG